ncbi:PQQ-binding-like beta-propeller repeat protein [Candidatus Poribacteria bacterium]|nr:PQQ-binding-like beta-propeller repeat protein [Candidatus Poribacteria bacterium]
MMKKLYLLFGVFLILGLCRSVMAGNWPTYQMDYSRSGVSDEKLNLPLKEVWSYNARHAPEPAWPPPAKADYWHNLINPRARVTYDRAFHLVSVDGSVYFSSSADDKVYCLDASTGEEKWAFFTEGPVRLAPTVWENRVYFGSDDGYVYCLKANNGELVWKYRASPEDRRIPGNGRIISTWPVRSGVVVDRNIAYFCSGIFPKEGVYVCALDALDGSEIWKVKQDISPQGYMLASKDRLYLPLGRVSPAVVNRENGELLGILSCPRAEGGTYTLLTDEALISGPGTQLTAFHPEENDRLATFNGYMVIVSSDTSYLLSEQTLTAVDRKKQADLYGQREGYIDSKAMLGQKLTELRDQRGELSGEALEYIDNKINEVVEQMSELDSKLKALEGKEYNWHKPCDKIYYSMALAGDTLYMGGDGVIEAVNVKDGKTIWEAKVDGKAYSLIVANKQIMVSTDKGSIHCFGSGNVSQAKQDENSDAFDDIPKECVSAIGRIAEELEISKGYCFVVGCEDGCLARELVKATKMQIICVCDDEKKAEEMREKFDREGLYGVRVSVHNVELDKLPYSDYLANLVVSESMLMKGEMPTSQEEVYRILKPFGGLAYLGSYEDINKNMLESWVDKNKGWYTVDGDGMWAIVHRAPLANSGEWTHVYADPGNTTCSNDQLIYGKTRVQWFGNPGPALMLDRHHRASVSLFKNGRLFVPADDFFIGVDAYNGTILWETEVPGSRRVGANRDAGNMVATDDFLYVTTNDECWAIDAATGEVAEKLKVPQLIDGEVRHWGYLACIDDKIYGSGRKEEAIYNETSKSADWELAWGDFKRMITSDYMFCMDRHSGDVIWTYKDGIIINPATAIGNGRLYLVESQNSEVFTDDDGKVQLIPLLKDGANMLAINLETGDVDWKHKVDFGVAHHIIYLIYSDGILLFTGSMNVKNNTHYYLRAFNADDGSFIWESDHRNNVPGVGGDHGEQVHHPVVIDGIVYAEPVAYNLETGKRVNTDGRSGEWEMPRRKGCGTVSGSSYCLFYRDHEPSMYDLRPSGGLTKLNHVTRLGCWINVIPAGGLVLIPEASSGCTCSYPLQTSMAFIPYNQVD